MKSNDAINRNLNKEQKQKTNTINRLK